MSYPNFAEMYRQKFESQDQAQIGHDNCERCDEFVDIHDFRTPDALEVYCCGCGADEGFCQKCQDELGISDKMFPDV